MPVNDQGFFERVWRFVDQFRSGDEVSRGALDAACNDLAEGINEALFGRLGPIYSSREVGASAVDVGSVFWVADTDSLRRYRKVSDGTAQLINRLAFLEEVTRITDNALLEAFIGLSAQTDRIPIFTGTETIGLLPISPYMKSLLGAVDAGSANETLGASAYFRSLFAAVDAPALRTLLGARTKGAELFQAETTENVLASLNIPVSSNTTPNNDPNSISTRGTLIPIIQALVAGQAIGVGQSWQNVTNSRNHNTTYHNTTGRPIMVSIIEEFGSSPTIQVSHNNSSFVTIGRFHGTTPETVSFIVPDGHYYRSNVNAGKADFWAELR